MFTSYNGFDTQLTHLFVSSAQLYLYYIFSLIIPQEIQLFEEACSLSLQSLSQSVYFPVLDNNASYFYQNSIIKQTWSEVTIYYKHVMKFNPEHRKLNQVTVRD